MRRDVVVRPARDQPIPRSTVKMFCHCGREISEHPTEYCASFHGSFIRVMGVARNTGENKKEGKRKKQNKKDDRERIS